MTDLIWLIPLLPLTGFLINGLLGNRLSEKQVATTASASVGLSFALTVILFFEMKGSEAAESVVKVLYPWIKSGEFVAHIGIQVDRLCLAMLLLVTAIGTLIHIYSIGFMHNERGFARYFALLNLCIFFTVVLIMADNLLLLFLGWQGISFCSYSLLWFWYQKDENPAAGRKAFVVNFAGDLGLLIAIFLLFTHFQTLNFELVFRQIPDVLNNNLTTTICLLLFLSVLVKSAQFPLHIWLPDSVTCPIPVSALLQSVTSVLAGLYLISRFHVLFLYSPVALSVVSVVGMVSAFFGAMMALAVTDIRKILSYSTISQAGLMFLACGIGAFDTAIFHLSIHAYAKVLLFFCAGNIMYTLQIGADLAETGGLKNKVPSIFRAFMIGALALSGIPFMSGFFSHEAILWKTLISHPLGGFIFGILTLLINGITVFYLFRMLYLAFYGNSKQSKKKIETIHELPGTMTTPVVILAVFAIVGGLINIPHFFNWFDQFLQPVFTKYVSTDIFSDLNRYPALRISFSGILSLVLILGIGFAYLCYIVKPGLPVVLSVKLKPIYNFLLNKWYIDAFYNWLILKPANYIARTIVWQWLEVNAVNGFINRAVPSVKQAGYYLSKAEAGITNKRYPLFIIIVFVLIAGYFLSK